MHRITDTAMHFQSHQSINQINTYQNRHYTHNKWNCCGYVTI